MTSNKKSKSQAAKPRSATKGKSRKAGLRLKEALRPEPDKVLPSFIIEYERAYKQFHEEIDKAVARAYKCHPNCPGFERCQWQIRLLHVFDLKQAVRDVTRVFNKFYRGIEPSQGRKMTPLVRKALQIKSESKGRTYHSILADEIPDWDKLDQEVRKAHIKNLRDATRQARKRTRGRLKDRGE